MSTILKDKTSNAFIEQDCTIELDGKSFTSGGAWLCQRVDTGKYEGYIYADPEKQVVTSWDGSLVIRAYISKPTWHNFSMNYTLRHVWFTYQGMNFYGKYCDRFNQCVHVKQVK